MRRKTFESVVSNVPAWRRSLFGTSYRWSLSTAAFVVFATYGSIAYATDGFQEGSFGDEPTSQPAGASEPEGNDEFGGSFGDDPSSTPEQAARPENDDDFGGSFGDDPAVIPDDDQRQERAETTPSDPDDGFVDEGNIDNQPDDGSPERPKRETEPETELVESPDDETSEPERSEQPEGPRVDPGVLAFETRDFGVPATNKLRSSNFHAPTPTSIPGGQLATTAQLAGALQSGQQIVVIDVLGADYTLPNAFNGQAMASPGNFQDRIQQQSKRWLGQITGNNYQIPIVVACSDPFCWLSYNAGLRVIAAGYQNVFWYRGGHQAWTMAGFQLSSAGF